jgi:hypothetical protein
LDYFDEQHRQTVLEKAVVIGAKRGVGGKSDSEIDLVCV